MASEGKKLRVKCDGPKCKGSAHHPACSVYKAALEEWAETLPPSSIEKSRNQRKKGRHDLPGTKTKEELAERSRQNGRKHVRSPIPLSLIHVLRKGKFRVRKEFQAEDEVSKAAADVAGWAFEQLAFVAAGRVHKRKAPAVAKAAQQLREEICEPIPREVRLSGGVDLGKALDSAQPVAPAVVAAESALADEKGK